MQTKRKCAKNEEGIVNYKPVNSGHENFFDCVLINFLCSRNRHNENFSNKRTLNKFNSENVRRFEKKDNQNGMNNEQILLRIVSHLFIQTRSEPTLNRTSFSHSKSQQRFDMKYYNGNQFSIINNYLFIGNDLRKAPLLNKYEELIIFDFLIAN